MVNRYISHNSDIEGKTNIAKMLLTALRDLGPGTR